MSDSPVDRTAADQESATWARDLAGTGPEHDAAVARLHAMLPPVSRSELSAGAPGSR